MGPAAVLVREVVKRLYAPAAVRHERADGRHAPLHWDPIGTRERAEVGVEGAILLIDDDDVLDLLASQRELASVGRAAIARWRTRVARAAIGRWGTRVARVACLRSIGPLPRVCRGVSACIVPRRAVFGSTIADASLGCGGRRPLAGGPFAFTWSSAGPPDERRFVRGPRRNDKRG